jgi:hypothetical protein
MLHPRVCAAALAAACLLTALPACAHGLAGNRFFPATIATDDPAVADELSLPTVSWTAPTDAPGASELDVSGEYSKRLTSRLGLSVEGAWTRLTAPGEPALAGFQNLETTVKYQFLTSAAHETILSAGLSVEWGRSGAERVGAEPVTTLTPTLYFGQGAGGLPDSLAWARPLAMTGLVGYTVPTRGAEGRALQTGFALEYSLGYLAAHVRDLGLPDFVNHLTPLVEGAFETPLGRSGGRTTGTINPGLIWSGQHFQLGAEAVVPINADSGRRVGVVVQAHFFLDDLFPRSLGRPIW